MRRTRSVAVAAAVVLTATTLAPASAAEPGTRPGPAADERSRHVQVERALASYDAMQRYLYADDGSSLYLEHFPSAPEDRTYSFEWPFSQAHIATLDLTGLPGRLGREFQDDLADREVGQERFWNAGGGTTGLPGYDSYPREPYGGGGDMFYDDNEWVALADIQQHLATGDAAALERAREIFELVVSGWDTDPTHAAPGGVFWTQATWSTDRNTVSTMPGAQLGVRLYQITGEQRYLDWALRMVAWTDEHLLAPNGLYWDNIKLDGTVDTRHFSYNQGVPVGVYTLLYQATGERRYLDKARSIAEASYRYFVEEGRLDTHEVFFNSIWFKNLLLFESVVGGTRYRSAMEAYADRQWDVVRDPATGLFPVNGTRTALLDQAAMVQIYATLAWPRERTAILY